MAHGAGFGIILKNALDGQDSLFPLIGLALIVNGIISAWRAYTNLKAYQAAHDVYWERRWKLG